MSTNSKNYRTNRQYYIYIIIHPKFKNWIKIGRTTNISSRINAYQTYCPNRDFKMVYNKYIGNSKEITTIENYFTINIHNNGFEWFNCSVQTAISIIEELSK